MPQGKWKYCCATCLRKMQNIQGKVVLRAKNVMILHQHTGEGTTFYFDLTKCTKRPNEGHICWSCADKAKEAGGEEIVTDNMDRLANEE